jgi:hypothetical protein
MKERLVLLSEDRAETGHPTHVMYAVHHVVLFAESMRTT